MYTCRGSSRGMVRAWRLGIREKEGEKVGGIISRVKGRKDEGSTDG